MTRFEIARQAWDNGEIEADTFGQLHSLNFTNKIILKAVERHWISVEFAASLLDAETQEEAEDEAEAETDTDTKATEFPIHIPSNEKTFTFTLTLTISEANRLLRAIKARYSYWRQPEMASRDKSIRIARSYRNLAEKVAQQMNQL